MSFNKFRYEYLLELWRNELREFSLDLLVAGKKRHLDLNKKLLSMDKNLVHRLLQMYLYRCKFFNVLTFL